MRPYEVHISRDEPIPLDEWVALIGELPGWELPKVIHGSTLGGEDISIPVEGLAWWDGHSDGQPYLFELIDGIIRFTDPDEETLRKAGELADRLGARVVGHDGQALQRPLD